MGDAAKKDDEAERMERLIACHEAAVNSINKLIQEIRQEREEKKKSSAKMRRVHERLPTAVVTDKVEAMAKRALARRGTRK